MSDIDHASIGALIENFMKAIRQNPNDLPEQQSSPAAHARPFPRTSPTNCDTRLSSSFELNPSHVGSLVRKAIGGNTEVRSLSGSSGAFKAIFLGRWSKGLSGWCCIPYHLLGGVERKRAFHLPSFVKKIVPWVKNQLTIRQIQDTIGMAGQVENLPRTAVLKLRRICRF